MSERVKRYDPINSDGTCGMCVEDADYGDYVEYADYAALEAECERLRAKVSALQSDANSWQSGYDKGREDGAKAAEGWKGQHASDSAELRRLCAERDALRAELAALKAPAEAGDEREAFEAHMVLEAGPSATELWIAGSPGSGYANERVNDYRFGWLAALEWVATRPAQTEQQPVAWGAFHFGGCRSGKLYNHCETEEQIESYIADLHRSNDSLTLRKGPLYAAPIAHTPADGLVEALSGLPDVCDGLEQEAFEDYARKEGMDMRTHPLHWLFLGKETYAARKGWRAAIRYCRAALADHRAGGAS